jgi:hypothetical protein
MGRTISSSPFLLRNARGLVQLSEKSNRNPNLGGWKPLQLQDGGAAVAFRAHEERGESIEEVLGGSSVREALQGR